jgi:HPt (histidine-containing phosphotransfer) domain-containing protein
MNRPTDDPLAGASGGSAAPGTAEVDLARLAEVTGGDPVLRRGLIDTFIQSGERALADIESALPRDDRERVCRAAHTLKGAAANMGAGSLQRAAAALEAASRTEPVEVLAGLARAVSGAFISTRGVFQASSRPGFAPQPK